MEEKVTRGPNPGYRGVSDTKPTNINLTPAQKAWARAQPGGMSETVRRLIDAKMRKEANK